MFSIFFTTQLAPVAALVSLSISALSLFSSGKTLLKRSSRSDFETSSNFGSGFQGLKFSTANHSIGKTGTFSQPEVMGAYSLRSASYTWGRKGSTRLLWCCKLLPNWNQWKIQSGSFQERWWWIPLASALFGTHWLNNERRLTSVLGQIAGWNLQRDVHQKIRVVIVQSRQFRFRDPFEFLPIRSWHAIPHLWSSCVHIVYGQGHKVFKVPAESGVHHPHVSPGQGDSGDILGWITIFNEIDERPGLILEVWEYPGVVLVLSLSRKSWTILINRQVGSILHNNVFSILSLNEVSPIIELHCLH